MIKVESRGKYAGVKIHLDAEEAQILLDLAVDHGVTAEPALLLTRKMGKKIREKLAENPDLLSERTPEQIAAILAKESDKAALQLEALKQGKDWKKVDPQKLEKALLKHVHKEG